MNTKKLEFVFALLSASSRIERRLDRALSSVVGISFSEYCLLKRLKEFRNGAATRVELAAAVQLTPSAITRALKPLEKIGYLSSEKSDRDARQSIATLTPAGYALLENAHSLVVDVVSDMSIPNRSGNEIVSVLNGISTK